MTIAINSCIWWSMNQIFLRVKPPCGFLKRCYTSWVHSSKCVLCGHQSQTHTGLFDVTFCHHPRVHIFDYGSMGLWWCWVNYVQAVRDLPVNHRFIWFISNCSVSEWVHTVPPTAISIHQAEMIPKHSGLEGMMRDATLKYQTAVATWWEVLFMISRVFSWASVYQDLDICDLVAWHASSHAVGKLSGTYLCIWRL